MKQDSARVLGLFKSVITDNVLFLSKFLSNYGKNSLVHLFILLQFAQLEHAKAAQSLNGKLEIAGRTIKVASPLFLCQVLHFYIQFCWNMLL